VRRPPVAALALLAVLALAVQRPGQAAAADATTAPCAECGMTVEVAGRFTARIDVAGESRYFCDIGDLVAFLGRTRPTGFEAAVRDYPSGEWVGAISAAYVVDKKTYPTPMGWGIAAFRDREAAPAGAMGFDALQEALR